MDTHARLIREAFHPELQSADIPGAGARLLPTRASAEETHSFPGQRTASLQDVKQFRSAEAAAILDDVRRAMERNPEGARAAALRLVTLLTLPAAGDPAGHGIRGGLAPWQKRKVDRYLQQRVERRLPVKELAEQVSLSVSHFCRAFKESFGTTPHAHITRLRIEPAQRLMLTTEDPLSQIALACGMADQAHLSKLFRRRVGETPTSWRRRNLTDAEAEARNCRRTGHPGAAPIHRAKGHIPAMRRHRQAMQSCAL